MDYTGFGKVLGGSAPAQTGRFRFTGEEADADLGMQRHGVRWYDLETGQWSSEDPIGILAGDFNMPVESRIYREFWGDFRDAFSAAGNGWGETKLTSWYGTRIDHVLYSPPWVCRRVSVGPPMGSDHCPLVADLAREGD